MFGKNRFASMEVMRIAHELMQDDVDWRLVGRVAHVLRTAKDYEYIITEGGKPEGEGWEKSPYSKNPNSYRREVGHGKKKTPSADSRSEIQTPFEEIPSSIRDAMSNTILDGDEVSKENLIDYMSYLSNSSEIMDYINLDEDSDDEVTFMTSDDEDDEPVPIKGLLYMFSDDDYGHESPVRKKMSALACRVFDVPADEYCLSKDELDDLNLSDEDVEKARRLFKKNQKAAYMAGLVDKDGYITAYRGTSGQYVDGKYSGANCESWAVSPKECFGGQQILKAKIPVSRVLGCFAGNREQYACDETEISVCTTGLDLQCEDLLEGTARKYDDIHRFRENEIPNAATRVRQNILDMKGETQQKTPKVETTKKEEEENSLPPFKGSDLGILEEFMAHGDDDMKKWAEDEFKNRMKQREESIKEQLGNDGKLYENLKYYKQSLSKEFLDKAKPVDVKEDFLMLVAPWEYKTTQDYKKAEDTIKTMEPKKFMSLLSDVYDDDVRLYEDLLKEEEAAS